MGPVCYSRMENMGNFKVKKLKMDEIMKTGEDNIKIVFLKTMNF